MIAAYAGLLERRRGEDIVGKTPEELVYREMWRAQALVGVKQPMKEVSLGAAPEPKGEEVLLRVTHA